MGGWLAHLAALARPERIRGIVGIAAAPDFTEKLIHGELDEKQRDTLMDDGIVYIDNPYGDKPYAFTRALIEDGRSHLLLGGPIEIHCPVRLVQGYADADVPWQTAMAIMANLESNDTAVTLVKDGDHRLSREQDLAKIMAAITDIITAPVAADTNRESDIDPAHG
jgi:pimeloyl-ACP methyl ester carboxylesterase